MFKAKALYDNIAESPDELAFRRGDIVTVTELDTGGLEGWWLCLLRGKQGIAPGNRLKILSGMSDYSLPDDRRGSIENGSNRSSWNSSYGKRSSGPESMTGEVYDEPNRSMQDYDVPPSRYVPKEIPKTSEVNQQDSLNCSMDRKSAASPILQGNNDAQFYDTPQPSVSVKTIPVPDNIYDVPQSSARNSREGSLSNRSSLLSNMSNESSLSASHPSSHRSSAVSMNCDSARSSLDVSSQELYDTPPKISSYVKQLSADSGLDVYDTPPKVKLVSPASVIEDYAFPKQKAKSIDLGISDIHAHLAQSGRNKSMEHAIDDVYDVPRNNTPRVQMKSSGGKIMFVSSDEPGIGNSSVCVYDIPPQVTRDSVISSRSDSSEEGQRLSTCSVDSRGSLPDIPTYDELFLEIDAALELLTKLQQDVQKVVNKFLGFVSSTWRKKENLQTKLYNIKLASAGVKDALKAFVQFAQGTLANSAKLPDKKLVNKLYKQVNPLQNSLQLISSALKNLDEIKWQTDLLAEPLDSSKSDDLGQIATLCKDLSSHVRKLASFIQGNSTLLFPKSPELDLDRRRNSAGDTSTAKHAKPPIGPKSDLAMKQRAKLVQQRPLPPPPTTDRALPRTLVEEQSPLPPVQFSDGNEDYLKVDPDKEGIYANDSSDWLREYDYVHLESKDLAAQLIIKEKMKHFEKDGSPVSDVDSEQKDDVIKIEDPYEVKLEADLESLDLSKQDEVDSACVEVDNGAVDADDVEQEVTTPVNRDMDMDMILPDKGDVVNLAVNGDKLDANDKQVLVFYSGQMETHSTLLNNALDAFFCCVESNEPPKVFISHSKFVIVSAHKLVYIGDTLHRNVMHLNVKNKIMQCANQLCDRLKLSVSATKLAALQYPSVPAVQEMVDRVVDVSKAAHKLKIVISEASSL